MRVVVNGMASSGENNTPRGGVTHRRVLGGLKTPPASDVRAFVGDLGLSRQALGEPREGWGGSGEASLSHRARRGASSVAHCTILLHTEID